MSEINFIVNWIELDELESKIENPDPSSGSTAIVDCQMPEIIELSANEIKELFEKSLNFVPKFKKVNVWQNYQSGDFAVLLAEQVLANYILREKMTAKARFRTLNSRMWSSTMVVSFLYPNHDYCDAET